MKLLRTTIVLAALALAVAPATAGEDSKRSANYREGQRALEKQDWEAASRLFGNLAASPGDETDAALYWKAYADWKRKLKKESLDSIRQLLSTYPQSAWADDAKTLELEIRDGKSGKPPADAADEELKLYALDGLMQAESEKAIPVLERILAGNASKRIKERALFVLSQSDSPRAREILLRIARSGQPLELRCEAVKTLGLAGEPEDIAALGTIARDGSAPLEVRRAVVDAYMISGRSGELLAMAQSDPDPSIRRKAIECLGANGELPALRQLFSTEKDVELRTKILESLGIAGDVETLARVARESTDPRIRRKAIEGLGISGDPSASKSLRQLYGELPAPEDKRKIVEAFMIQGDAKALIELFRAERDPGMKKIILQNLSVMNDPEATNILLEVLGEKP